MSIQQRIASDVYRMADRAITPDQIKAVQAHLVKSVQDGAVPSYVGVPLLNDLNQKMSRIQNASAQSQAMVQQPPIAQQVVGQAEQEARAPMQGVTALPSGLPEQGMAGGGIIAFSDGGMSDSQIASYLLSDEEDDEDDYVNEILRDFQMSDAAKAMRHETGSEGLASIAPMMATSGKESMSIKEEGRPVQTAERKTSSVTRPGGVEDLLKIIEQKESGGRRYDKAGNLLTSPKGAMGEMQVMPGTVRDPGYGVAPARDSSPDEMARVGRDYYKAMLSRYNDPKIAAIAYNWGPRNTDKWLTAGADMGRLPAETRQYAQGFAEGGIASVKRFQYGGISATSPFDISALGLDDLKRMASMGERTAIEELAKRQGAAGISSVRAPSPSAAEMNLGNARVVGGAQPAAPAAAAATEGGVGGLWNAVKSGLGRLNPRGLGAWGLGTYSPELNVGEEEQLKKIWAAQEAGAGRGTKPASSYNVPAAQAATQRPSMQQRPAENAYTRGQDIDDMLAGASTQDLSQQIEMPKEGGEDAASAGKEESGIRSILNKYRSDVGKQREIDAYLSLLSAGLGMMGGTSPYGMANIGQGAQRGVSTYAQLGQQRGADERALLGAEIGLEKYKMLGDIRKQQFAAGQEAKAAAIEDKQARTRLAENKLYSDQLNEIRRLAQQQALAQYKGELLPEDKERVLAKAEVNLLADPAYRNLYKRVYGFEPAASSGGRNTIQFGDLGKK